MMTEFQAWEWLIMTFLSVSVVIVQFQFLGRHLGTKLAHYWLIRGAKKRHPEHIWRAYKNYLDNLPRGN